MSKKGYKLFQAVSVHDKGKVTVPLVGSECSCKPLGKIWRMCVVHFTWKVMQNSSQFLYD